MWFDACPLAPPIQVSESAPIWWAKLALSLCGRPRSRVRVRVQLGLEELLRRMANCSPWASGLERSTSGLRPSFRLPAWDSTSVTAARRSPHRWGRSCLQTDHSQVKERIGILGIAFQLSEQGFGLLVGHALHIFKAWHLRVRVCWCTCGSRRLSRPQGWNRTRRRPAEQISQSEADDQADAGHRIHLRSPPGSRYAGFRCIRHNWMSSLSL